MSERKAINKYYPPDYDPVEAERIARSMSKKLKNANKSESTIRLMTPFSMRCTKCDEYISKSRKFNGKKKTLDEKYLDSIKIYRFTIRCPQCANPISFRTDPKSADYVMESGGVRNYIKRQEEEKKAQDETLEETLKRLAKEKEEEEELKQNKGKSEDKSKDKMALLEEKLAKLQQQQKDVKDLEQMIQNNKAKYETSNMLGKISKPKNNAKLEQQNLDAIAESAFAKFRSHNSISTNDDKSETTAVQNTDTFSQLQSRSNLPELKNTSMEAKQKPTKIKLKVKRNTLGIVKRQRK